MALSAKTLEDCVNIMMPLDFTIVRPLGDSAGQP